VAFAEDLLDGRIKFSSKIFIDKVNIVINMKEYWAICLKSNMTKKSNSYIWMSVQLR
jgi:hypothetical protein